MRRPARYTLARLLAIVVVLIAACADQRLSSPTSPSVIGPSSGKFESEDESPDVGLEQSGPLASLSIDPSVFTGGESTRGTVTLAAPAPAGGMVITLTSDDGSATVPASVTIAAGGTSSTFSITTKRVSADLRIRVTASAAGGTLTALMRLRPVIALASLTADPVTQVGGRSITGTATLTAVNTAGATVVILSSENDDDARVPATVAIAQGSTSATFTIETREVSTNTEIWIHGRVGTTEKQSVQIRLARAVATTTTGTVTIGGVVK